MGSGDKPNVELGSIDLNTKIKLRSGRVLEEATNTRLGKQKLTVDLAADAENQACENACAVKTASSLSSLVGVTVEEVDQSKKDTTDAMGEKFFSEGTYNTRLGKRKLTVDLAADAENQACKTACAVKTDSSLSSLVGVTVEEVDQSKKDTTDAMGEKFFREGQRKYNTRSGKRKLTVDLAADAENQECQNAGALKTASSLSSLVGVTVEEVDQGKNNKKDLGVQKTKAHDFDDSNHKLDEGTSLQMSGKSRKGRTKNGCHQFDVGDLVWGKITSYPWWPGLIFDEALAPSSVLSTKEEGCILVAFYGDNTYGWIRPRNLIPFGIYHASKSRQADDSVFLRAVEEAGQEFKRRSTLGLVCHCQNPPNFIPRNDGEFEVKISGFVAGGVYSAKQIEKARDDFQPSEVLACLKQIALSPRKFDEENHSLANNTEKIKFYRSASVQNFNKTHPQPVKVRQRRRKDPGSSKIESPEPMEVQQRSRQDPQLIQMQRGSRQDPGSSKVDDPEPVEVQQGSRQDSGSSKVDDPEPMEVQQRSRQDAGSSKVQNPEPIEVQQRSHRDPGSSNVENPLLIQMQQGSGQYPGSSKVQNPEPIEVQQRSHQDPGSSNVENPQLIQMQQGNREDPESSRVAKVAVPSRFNYEPPRLDSELSYLQDELVDWLKAREKQATKANDHEGEKDGLDFCWGRPSKESSGNPYIQIASKRSGLQEQITSDGASNVARKLKMSDFMEVSRLKKPVDLAGNSGNQSSSINVEQEPKTEANSGRSSDEPRMLVIKFPLGAILPSVLELKAKFARFGPFSESSIAVSWLSSRCQIVFHHNTSAAAAYLHATQSTTLFSSQVTYELQISRVAGSELARSSQSSPEPVEEGPLEIQPEPSLSRTECLSEVNPTPQQVQQRARVAESELPKSGQPSTRPVGEGPSGIQPDQTMRRAELFTEAEKMKREVCQDLAKEGPSCENSVRSNGEPWMLVINFSPKAFLPSAQELKTKFARFGPIHESSIEISWKPARCKIIFQNKTDAAAAYHHAIQSRSLFSSQVSYELQMAGVAGSELCKSSQSSTKPVEEVIRGFNQSRR